MLLKANIDQTPILEQQRESVGKSLSSLKPRDSILQFLSLQFQDLLYFPVAFIILQLVLLISFCC